MLFRSPRGVVAAAEFRPGAARAGGRRGRQDRPGHRPRDPALRLARAVGERGRGRRKYINRSIDSILNQDYENIELLIIDDGSTDETAEIANKRIVSDSRAVVLSKQNGGLSDARNYGLVRASGDYIMFIDSDDFLEINSLGSLLKYSTNNCREIGRASCRERV